MQLNHILNRFRDSLKEACSENLEILPITEMYSYLCLSTATAFGNTTLNRNLNRFAKQKGAKTTHKMIYYKLFFPLFQLVFCHRNGSTASPCAL